MQQIQQIKSLLLAIALLPLGLPAIADVQENSGFGEQFDNKAQSGPSRTILKGGVQHNLAPLREGGAQETIKPGTPLNLTISANLNSEWAQVGDRVYAMVSADVKDGQKVLLPGQWRVAGKITQVQKHRRGGRDGYIEIRFDKLISPDGKYEVPFDATVSTKDSAPKAIAKHIVKDSAYMGVGAVGGALLSVQLTGIPLAVATQGYSVAIGAAAGATIGAVAAASRKGKILAALPGDEITLKTNKPVSLPAFNAEALPSAAPPEQLDGVDIAVIRHKIAPDPYGDKKSCLVTVNFKLNNRTENAYSLSDFAILSDRNQLYYPFVSIGDIKERSKRVEPRSSQEATITFHAGNPKHKYYLVLLDRGPNSILARIPIN